MGENMAKKYGIKFTEVSAKDNKNIDIVFENLCKTLLNKIPIK